MAVTTTLDSGQKGRFYSGSEAVRRGTINLGSSYATNGNAVTAAICKLRSLDALVITPSGGLVPEWDKANAKIKLYWVDTSVDGAPMAEVTNSDTTCNTVNFRFEARGK